MTTRTFRITVVAPPTSYIGGTLKPSISAGQFSADFGSACGINDSKGYNGLLPGEQGFVASSPVRRTFNAKNATSNFTTTSFAGKSVFDSVTNCWFFVGGTTGAAPGSMTVHRYSVADNNWRHWQGETEAAPGVFLNHGNSHNFGSSGIDSVRRKLYHLCTQGASAAGNVPGIGRWSLDAVPGTLPGDRLSASKEPASTAKFYPTEACPEAGVLLAINYSSTTLPNSIWRWSLDTGAALTHGTRLFNDIDRAATCYLNGKVYATGDSNRFYSIEPTTGAMTQLTSDPTPVVMSGKGSNSYQFTILIPLGGYIYAFVLCPTAVGRGVYRFNPNATAGSRWSGQLATNFPSLPITGTDSDEGKWTVGPVESEGVALMVAAQSADLYHNCYIWKPPA